MSRANECNNVLVILLKSVEALFMEYVSFKKTMRVAKKEVVVASSAGRLDGAGADVASGVLASSSTHDPLDLLRHEDGLSLLLAS